MPFIYFRRHQKALLWIIVLVIAPSFALFGVLSARSAGGGGVKGYVLGKKITERAYGEAYDRWRRVSYLHGRREMITEAEMDMNFAFIIIADMWGIRVPDVKVAERIKTIFSGMKEFSTSWLREILYRHNLTIQDYEKTISEMLKNEALIEHVVSTVKLTEDEARHLYRFENGTVKLALVRFAAKDFEKLVETDTSSVSLFFNNERSRYRAPETFEFEYITSKSSDLAKTVEITDKEIEDFYKKNKKLYKNPPSKEEAEEAEENSKENSRGKKKKTKKKSEETPEYKPLEEVKEEIEARLRKDKGDKKAVKAIQELEQRIIDAAEPPGLDLKALAEEAGLKHNITTPLTVSEMRSHLHLAASQEKLRYLCDLDPGYPSVVVSGNTSSYIARLIKKHDSYDPELSEVQDRVKKDMVRAKAVEKAMEAARNFAALDTDASLEQLAEKEGLKVEQHGPFNRRNMYLGIPGTTAILLEKVFNTPVGKSTEAVLGNECAFVAKVLGRGDPDWKVFEEQSEALLQRYLSMRKKYVLDRWFSSLDIRLQKTKKL